MNESTSLIIVGIGFICLLIGLTLSVILAPKPWIPERQWIARSLLSSFSGILSVFVFVSTLAIRDQNFVNYQRIWNSISSMLVFIMIGGILFAVGLYIRVIIWKKRDDLTQGLIKKMKNK
jgi:signal transduction histidine kinase